MDGAFSGSTLGLVLLASAATSAVAMGVTTVLRRPEWRSYTMPVTTVPFGRSGLSRRRPTSAASAAG